MPCRANLLAGCQVDEPKHQILNEVGTERKGPALCLAPADYALHAQPPQPCPLHLELQCRELGYPNDPRSRGVGAALLPSLLSVPLGYGFSSTVPGRLFTG